MRFFYTDPLAAAWMAKHFGMKFVSSAGEEIKWCFVERCFYTDSHPQEWDMPFCIHPDSLRILEPSAGDLIQRIGHTHTTRIMRAEEAITVSLDTHKIIQRNGVAFLWPEMEQ